MVERCEWAVGDGLYEQYHDTEWGVPQFDGRALWENLVLEGFQAGLSWITVLRRRNGFRAAFADFTPARIAPWGPAEVERLVGDERIIRHRGKIEATILNARAYLEIEAGAGFSAFVWRYVDGEPLQPCRRAISEVPANTALSTRLSKDLKAAGFRFCGPTTVYAFMQASGLVNDHLTRCHRHAALFGAGDSA